MITIHIMGGLGNQLFQIFSCTAIAMDHGLDYKFNCMAYIKDKQHRSKNYLDSPLYYYFLGWDKEEDEKSHRMLIEDFDKQFMLVNEPVFSYKPVVLSNKQLNYKLYGYYQSYKYFEKYKNVLFKKLNLPFYKKEVWKKSKLKSSNIISLHFRIGDYKEIQDCHPILPNRYYYNAIKHMEKSIENFETTPILYFYQKGEEDQVEKSIEYLKEFYKNEFIAIDHEFSDWEQLILMSCCKYNIIANSTFSWWSAYFNYSPQKKVCYPSVWFGPKLEHDTTDLFPTDWVSISTKK